MNVETANKSYSTKSNARRALNRIVRNNDDLLEKNDDGSWTFDVAMAQYQARMEPDNAVGDTNELANASEVVQGDSSHTNTTEENAVKTENVSLEQAQAEAAELEAKEKAQLEAEKKAEKERIAAEKAEAKRVKAEAAKAEKEAKAAERAAAKEAKKAEKEAERAKAAEEKAARKTNKDAEKDAKRAEREAKAAEKLAAKQAKQDAKDAARAAKLEAEEARKAAKEAARADREASTKNGIRKPGAGSKLGNLWELIEALKEALGRFPTFKEFSEANKEMTYEQAGGDSTRTTAYYDYRMYYGVTGRVVEPKAEGDAEAKAE